MDDLKIMLEKQNELLSAAIGRLAALEAKVDLAIDGSMVVTHFVTGVPRETLLSIFQAAFDQRSDELLRAIVAEARRTGKRNPLN